ncbi:MAG: helix-turn-helix domain-containing protein [Bacteroidetes bacterium]|nr:helix-turn-helix domain-containing protein [Bacteroidota bacterium]MBU1679004.1 helix-turn-helix domain-containing protein [Bacteroidota bacterium]
MKKITTFEEHLDKQYGKKGSSRREKFETDSIAFRLGEMLKVERKKAKMTQEQLAEKTGTKKSYISRIEAGKSDIQISTFYRIIELGLEKRVSISIS